MKLTNAAFLAALALGTGAAHAQTPTASTSTTTVTGASIDHRETKQQDRIANGLDSGQITAGEAASLEKQEAGIKTEEAGMREQDNGKLTTQDKKTLNTQLNVESKDIYADKHNSSTRPVAGGEVNKRLDNQQDRIAAGIKDDKLTDGQVVHLETQEAGITKEEAGMRAQDDGKLTAQDQKTLNHQLNEESRRINRDERRTTHRHK